jgi:hypothetical protein
MARSLSKPIRLYVSEVVGMGFQPLLNLCSIRIDAAVITQIQRRTLTLFHPIPTPSFHPLFVTCSFPFPNRSSSR